MKKVFMISALLLVFLMSGCSTGSRNVAISTPMNVSTPVSVSTSTPLTVYMDKDGKIECDSCEKEEPINKCAQKVRYVNYNDTCHGLCGFTVTERRVSNCESDMQKTGCDNTPTCYRGGR